MKEVKKVEFEELFVGATIWRYDHNKRRYTEGNPGNQVTERERFDPLTIIGETTKSWLVKHYNNPDKIPKDSSKWKDGFYRTSGGFPRLYALSAQAIDDRCWETENRYRIQAKVQGASIAQLRAIAEIIGYHE